MRLDPVEKARSRAATIYAGLRARARVRREFDPNEPRDESGRWTDGGGSDGGGASEKPSADAAPSSSPSIEQLKTWDKQITDRQAELEKAGQIGNDEDSNLQRMSGAIGMYLRMGYSDPNVGIQIAKDGDKLHAAVATHYYPDKKVTEIAFAGGLNGQAFSAALQLARIRAEEMGAKRVEGNMFADDEATIKAYADAGFERWGSITAGVITMKSGEGTTPEELQAVADQDKAHVQMVRGMANSVAKKLDYDPNKIVFGTEGDFSQNFTLNGKQYKAAGLAYTRSPDPAEKGTIRLYPQQMWNEKSVEGVTAHEIEHIKFQEALDRFEQQREAVMKDPGPPPNPNGEHYWERAGGTDAMMKPDGTLRPPYDQKYPIYALMYPVLNIPSWEQFASSDGVSPYSIEYWKQWEARGKLSADFLHAQHETLAEMAKAKYTTGRFPEHQGGRDLNVRIWRDLFRTVDKVHKLK